MQPDWQLLLGPFGLLVGLAVGIVTLWKKLSAKDAELAREHEARLNDAKQYTDTLVRMTEAMHQAVDHLGQIQCPMANRRATSGTSQRG